MPYIKRENREKILNDYLNALDYSLINTAGELQYAIAVMIKDYLERKGLNYQHCNDIMGALAGAQMEFYRRTVAPYEVQKIEENGDI